MPHNNNNKYDFVLNSVFVSYLLISFITLFDTCMFNTYELFAALI